MSIGLSFNTLHVYNVPFVLLDLSQAFFRRGLVRQGGSQHFFDLGSTFTLTR